MKKKWIFLLLFIIGIVFINNDVYAKMDTTTMEMECIYANGVVIGISYDTARKVSTAYVKEYPVVKSVVVDGDPMTNISLYSLAKTKEVLGKLTCPAEVRYWIAWELASEMDENGNATTGSNRNFKGIYSYSWCTNKSSGCVDGDPTITKALRSTKTTGWWIFGSEQQTGGTIPVYASNLASEKEGKPEALIPLVAERLYVVGDLAKEDYSVSYKSAAEEAIGSAGYVQFLKKGSTYYVKRGKTITSVSSNTGQIGKDYICFKESTSEQDSSRGNGEFRFSSIRHEIKAPSGSGDKSTCSTGYSLYKLDDKVCAIGAEDRKKSFCDEYGNTAAVLIRILQIMQVIVPGLVIVLTGIEIARIVIAGNVEEELPKRKKMIIVRMIIMITFFFLPVIAELVTTLLVDKEVYDISCLFNNGVQDKGTEDAECVELADEESGD